MTTILEGDQARLFSADDLGNLLGKPEGTISDSRAVTVEQMVWGWLKPALGATTRPQPVTPEVFSWALELGAIAHENPAGLSSEQLGPAQRAFSKERRLEILAEAANGGVGGTKPRGCFPPAQCYPDPAW